MPLIFPLLPQSRATSIVCIGELLWDLLPSGPQLGGAPSNLAVHLAALGAQSVLISRVGADDRGREALRRLAARGVNISGVSSDDQLPTGTVGVTVDALGQPEFNIHSPVAWDALEATDTVRCLTQSAGVLCFGTLAQRNPRSRHAIQTLRNDAAESQLIVCDINLRAPFYNLSLIENSLEGIHILKLNETELPLLNALFGLGTTVQAQVESLAARFKINTVILTLGKAGSRLWRQGHWFIEAGRTVHVRDSVGAGDAFTAACILGFIKNWSEPEILSRASDIASYVCTQPGATPEIPADLTPSFRAIPANS